MIGRTGEFNVGALTEDVPYETIRYFGFQTCHEVNKFEGCEGFKRSCNKLLRLTGHTNAPPVLKNIFSQRSGLLCIF